MRPGWHGGWREGPSLEDAKGNPAPGEFGLMPGHDARFRQDETGEFGLVAAFKRLWSEPFCNVWLGAYLLSERPDARDTTKVKKKGCVR